MTIPSDLNLSVPHTSEDADEQQKILIENFDKIREILVANIALLDSYGIDITANSDAIAALGTAAAEDVGTAIGNVVQLVNVGGVAGLPAVDGSQLTGLGSSDSNPIGTIIAVQDNLPGAGVPTQGNYIKLTAGQTGVGQYNEGLLINESITGSTPLVVATADINDVGSPLNGQTINLINTENRYPMPGTSAGTTANDHIQNVTGGVYLDHQQNGSMVRGDTAFGALYGDVNASGGRRNTYYSVAGTYQRRLRIDSSRVVRTSDHTNVKRIEVTYYMRIK